MEHSKIENCPVCDSREIALIYETIDRHYGLKDHIFVVWKCSSCELLFLNPMLSQDSISSLYPESSYYSYKPNKKKRSFLKGLLLNTATHEEYWSSNPNIRLLDFGSGYGEKLLEYKEKHPDWELIGVELNDQAAEVGKQLGVDIRSEDLLSIGFEDNYFDVVRCNHSLEHIVNPATYLIEQRRILRDDGVLYLGLPNTKSIQYRIFGKYWFLLGVPFHPYSYNPNNIAILLSNCGFEVKEIKYNANHGGILGSIQIFLNRNNGRNSRDGKFSNALTRVLCHQLARLSNLFGVGDRMEVIALKKAPISSN